MTSACSSIDIFDSEGKNDGWYFRAMAMLVVKGESVSRDPSREEEEEEEEEERVQRAPSVLHSRYSTLTALGVFRSGIYSRPTCSIHHSFVGYFGERKSEI